jgi:hippurate hydrolase
MNLLASIVANAAAMTELRRDLHAHPELSYQEERTAAQVAAKLAEWGIAVHQGLGKTGLVGVIQGRDGGKSGRAVGLRADMDALPITECNAFTHKSRNPGKMHACGHDGHVVMLLAAAQYLAAQRAFLEGTVYLIFQPAEESGGGARAMIDDGLFTRFPVEAVFGLHNWPDLPEGTLAVSPGPVMASANDFHITLIGKGGHAAMPHLGIDPVVLACQLVQAFQTIVARNKNPADAGVISVTMIHAGEADNVIPDTCQLQGTVRTFTAATLDLIERRMRELVGGLCTAFGAAHRFEFRRSYPPTVNSAYEADFARRVMCEIVGQAQTRTQEPSMGAEDFAFMLQARPGAYAFIGNGVGAHDSDGAPAGQAPEPCALHSARYDFNDALIALGATYWARLAQSWLAHRPPRFDRG